MNSRSKGKRGELEAAKLLKDFGYDARRGQQFSGANGDPDIVGLPGIHIEVKRVEKLNIEKAVEQSCLDAKLGELPIVLHRKNRQPWLVTMTFLDWMNLYKAWEKVRQ